MVTRTHFSLVAAAAVALLTGADGQLAAEGWTRFRGPNGSGVSTESNRLPESWSETQNLKWKTRLPGPGLSSPVVTGDCVFVTCWSGYGVDREAPGTMQNLRRHLICVDRRSGEIRWDRSVPAFLPEEEFRGMFAENGYASHTPVTDGERVYAFFGKSGIHAFDLTGKELWHHRVGDGDDRRGWGTAASPILYQNRLIVPATIESHALIAFDKVTGVEVWRQEAEGFHSTWGTPVLVDVPDGRTDLVIAVPYEVWGLNPENGKLRWYCETETDSVRSSPVVFKDVVYLIEGRSGAAIAIRAGGLDNVTSSHVVWTARHRNSVGTPLVHDGHLYWISGGIAHRADAATGKELGVPLRLQKSEAEPVVLEAGDDERAGSDRSAGGFRGGFGSRGGPGGGRMGGQDYSSPVCGDGKLYYFTRSGEGIVLKLGEKLEQVAANRFASDSSEISATPALAGGEILIRSNLALYCIAETAAGK